MDFEESEMCFGNSSPLPFIHKDKWLNQNSILDGLNVFKQIVNYNTRGLVFLEGSIFDRALADILLVIPVFPWHTSIYFENSLLICCILTLHLQYRK